MIAATTTQLETTDLDTDARIAIEWTAPLSVETYDVATGLPHGMEASDELVPRYQLLEPAAVQACMGSPDLGLVQ